MTIPRVSPKLTTPFWAAFRRHSHNLLAIGYREALPRILTEPEEETDITGYICAALKKWFRANPGKYDGFDVHDDPHVELAGKTGKRRPRADIIITYTAGIRPEFCFEAKRLHRTKARASHYTDEEGMGCFISGRYASSYAEAAMIGYVQTDTLERWHGELQARVQKQVVELNLESTEAAVNFASAFPLEWVSTHRRDVHGPVRLFHIILDCRKAGHDEQN
jgi:hypothetical protein